MVLNSGSALGKGVGPLLIQNPNNEDVIWNKLFEVYYDEKTMTELKQFLYCNIKNVELGKVIEIVNAPFFTKERKRFDNTLEWFVAELMIRKFGAFASSFGVEVKNIIRNSTDTKAGDFDALVVLRNMNLAYFECKGGGYECAQLF